MTAGPTYEDFDPVRYVGNRSSGRMGFALAAEAARRGAEVTLVAGPTPSSRRRCTSSCACAARPRCTRAVMARAGVVDVVIMAAAVADYAPAEVAPQKVAKTGDTLTLVLHRTPDILADLGARRADDGGGPFSSASPPRPRTSWRARRRSASASRPTSSSPTTCRATDAGFDVDDQRR